MGSRVIDASRTAREQGLPIPTTGKAVVFYCDLLDVTELSLRNNAAGFGVNGCEEGLLEYGEGYAVLFGKRNKGVALQTGACKRLFNDNVKAVSDKVAGNRIMLVGIGSVYDKVDVAYRIKLLVRGKRLTARVFSLCSFSAGGVALYDVFNLADIIQVGFEVSAVDIPSASSLSDYGKTEFFHFFCPFFIKSYYNYIIK